MGKEPIGIKLLPSVSRGPTRDVAYKIYILVLTFFCYTCYHLSRKPISIVKSRLYRNCSDPSVSSDERNGTECDWKPFDKSDASALLGGLDLAYLFAYAVGMFCSGHIAERISLRLFMSAGMILTGVFTAAFGLGYFFNIHSFYYYVIVQIFGGLAQSTGWPSVVTCVGNWYGKGKRGLIMGIWNSHTSVGNILGSIIAGAWVDGAWGWSFVVPGIIIASMGVLVFLFLVPEPADVGCTEPASDQGKGNEEIETQNSFSNYKQSFSDDQNSVPVIVTSNGHTHSSQDCSIKNGYCTNEKGEIIGHAIGIGAYFVNGDTIASGKLTHCSEAAVKTQPIINRDDNPKRSEAVSIWRALFIPGVIEFSLCLFFAKLVSYTFLFWLPKYISNKTSYSAEKAGDLSTLMDVGGIAGGIAAGMFSDYTRGKATTCVVMLVLGAPMMFIYNEYGSIDYAHSVGLLLLLGFMVNGPYALITTAVSADLGTHKSLKGNAKALATVTAIIDGTGSVGAALGPLFAGVISKTGWNNVFWMLIGCDILAIVFLVRLVYKEIKLWKLVGCGPQIDDPSLEV
ncbi:glucose-6-phosphate exchanger SLC37A2-like isoform X2 [Dreissena polymorpha]|uniref:glucose-6-phosphate exchanger SLC37A2-like isoform X2 n=1 Tax=Dreissena polymorpha TaxID=45954 RepID=UPI002263B078|nr:glucose-6-phosphate exchanger SLC37A2-like isoform X2 [Dreissena polymorpha]